MLGTEAPTARHMESIIRFLSRPHFRDDLWALHEKGLDPIIVVLLIKMCKAIELFHDTSEVGELLRRRHRQEDFDAFIMGVQNTVWKRDDSSATDGGSWSTLKSNDPGFRRDVQYGICDCCGNIRVLGPEGVRSLPEQDQASVLEDDDGDSASETSDQGWA